MSDRPIRSPLLQDKTLDGGYVMVSQQTWRTTAIDVTCGLLAPVPVAPLVAIVDAAIINSVNGDRTPVLKGIKDGYKKLLTTPHKFVMDPRWQRITALCWMVYGGTYASANVATSYIESNKVGSSEAKILKASTSSTFNIGLTLVKDVLLVGLIAQLAKDAGNSNTSKPKGYVPMRTRACFMTRDVMTMAAAFVIADSFGRWMVEKTDGWLQPRQARIASNLTLPVLIQPFSTVLHLYGLNYAKDQTLAGGAMASAIQSNYAVSTISRMARILPAIGLGNNMNNELRNYVYRRAESNRWI